MPCNQDCQQGRRCDCSCNRASDRAAVVICSMLLFGVISIGYGVYEILNITSFASCEHVKK